MLVAFAGGKLDAREIEGFEAHLASCAECCALVVDLVGGSTDDALPPTKIEIGEPRPARATAPALALDTGPRFEIVAALGAGGMGVVYAARDRARDGALVALKALPSAAAGQAKAVVAERLLRFKREFRVLAGLSHVHLVRLGELVEHAGLWMFTMELVEGVDFLAWVRPGGSLDIGRLATSIEGLAQGVEALHEAGCVHRDLKPSNVLVTVDGVVKILDFGLVSESDGPHDLTGAGAVVGTVAYMSPEQAAGDPATKASDWWSVGAMLYEALAGRRPHTGAVAEVLRRKRAEDPPPPEGVPRPLADLAMALLARDPTKRASAAAIHAALGVWSREAPSEDGPLESFVGRSIEVGRVFEALDESRTRAVVALLTGESGIGKSALAETFAERARRTRGAVVLWGRCHEREEIPFRAIDAAVDALAEHLVARAPSTLVAPEGAALLVHTFPVLGRVPALAAAEARPAPSARGEHARLSFEALRALLGTLGEETPVALVVDDFQWSDDDSLAALREIARAPDAPRVLILGTVRSGTGRSAAALAEALGVTAQRVEVGPLSPAAGEELARRLGAGARSAELARAAGGHPLFLRELSRGGPLEATLEEVLARRVAAESDVGRRSVELLCLVEAPLAAGTLARAVQVDVGDLGPRLDAMVGARLLRRAPGDRVEPFHARVREAIRSRIPPDAILDGHRRLLDALRGAGAPLEELLPHLRATGDTRGAREASEALAERATEGLAFAEAARLFALALDAIPEEQRDERRRIWARHAEVLGFAGRGARAAQSWLEAARLADDPWEAAESRRRALDELVRGGRADEGLALLDGALAPAGIRVPRSLPGTVAALLVQRLWHALRGTRFRARAESDCDREALLRIDLCYSVAAALFAVDVVRRALLFARHLSLAVALGEPRRVARALATWALVVIASASRRDRRYGARLVARAEEVARDLAHPETERFLDLARGLGAQSEGRWPEGTAALDRAAAVRLARRDHDWERAAARVLGAICLSWEGRVAELRSRVRAMLRDAEDRDDAYTSSYLAVGGAVVLWLAEDDPAELRARVLRAGELQSQTGVGVFGFQQRVALVEADLYEAEPRRAWSRISPALGPAGRVLYMRVRWRELRARAALAPALATDDRRALASAEADTLAVEALALPWASAHARLLSAGIASAKGARGRARALLDEAIPLLDRQGMQLWAAAARLRADELAGERAEAVEAWMRAQGIVAPAKIARWLVPV